jgi:hypothetical protein
VENVEIIMAQQFLSVWTAIMEHVFSWDKRVPLVSGVVMGHARIMVEKQDICA